MREIESEAERERERERGGAERGKAERERERQRETQIEDKVGIKRSISILKAFMTDSGVGTYTGAKSTFMYLEARENVIAQFDILHAGSSGNQI